MNKYLKAQTLVETVATMAVAVIIIAALVGMAVVSLRSSNLSRSKAVAAQFLNELIDQVRVYRDTNTFGGLTLDLVGGGVPIPSCPSVKQYFYFDPTTGELIYNSTTPLTVTVGGVDFNKYFSACSQSSDILQVTASVEWADSSGSRVIRSTAYFSSWK